MWEKNAETLGKAAGPEDVPNRVLKTPRADQLADLMTDIYNITLIYNTLL